MEKKAPSFCYHQRKTTHMQGGMDGRENSDVNSIKASGSLLRVEFFKGSLVNKLLEAAFKELLARFVVSISRGIETIVLQ